MSNNWINMVQIAIKAGKVQVGSNLIPSIQSQKAKLVLISETCGNNTKKKVLNKTEYYSIPCVNITQEDMEKISIRNYSALAITDDGFAQTILKKVGENDGLQ